MQYIIRRRIGEAQNQLISTNLSIAEIAEKAGFTDTSYFDVMFRKKVGTSPRKYRRIYHGME